MYTCLHTSQSATVAVRHLDYHVRRWGAPAAGAQPPLVLLHGWMDVGASWQFVVDAFSDAFLARRAIVAPDWRGFGRTPRPAGTDCYHFVDYLADLDQLLDQVAGGQPVDLVGHSMGGNVAMMYAGARPERIRRLVNLEGFGMPASTPQSVPGRLAQWMDGINQCERGALDLKDYDSADAVAQRLIKTNPRLAPDKARWLARQWAREGEDGRWRILGDAAHKIPSALPYRVDEAQALYAAITAPVLAVHASDDSLGRWYQGKYTLEQYLQRLTAVRDVRTAVVQDAGHMLHHDQPRAVAALIERFVQGEPPGA